jgi:NitT/TauT family transport system substrate-binding protein
MPRLTMLLNTIASGPQGWLYLAQARGYVAEAGVELVLTPGTGAFNAAPGMVAGGYDLGYGDINALVEVVARQPQEAPIGVYATFGASPSAIAVGRGGPIRKAADLAGKRITGHATDVALLTFGAFCAAQGVDAASVVIAPVEGSMAAMGARLAAGEVDGIFAYVSTLSAAYAAIGQRAEDHLRFLRYDEMVPDLYGSAVMASRRLVREEPAVLRRLVAAFARGVAEARAEPAAAMAALRAAAPGLDLAVEALRWEKTLAVEMATGGGGVEPARFARAVALQARTAGLPRIPDPAELFSDAFLPA